MIIELGSFSKPLHEQIGCEPEIVEFIEKSKHALNLLRIQQIITKSESVKAERRLLRKLNKTLQTNNIKGIIEMRSI